jgi:hypothetical protein
MAIPWAAKSVFFGGIDSHGVTPLGTASRSLSRWVPDDIICGRLPTPECRKKANIPVAFETALALPGVK